MPAHFRTAPAASSASAVDRGAVRQLEEQLGKDGLAELVTRFLDCTPERLAGLRSAVAARDASALRDAAHSLKGAARSFGAAEMGEIAAQVEQESATGSLEGADARVAALAVSFERTRAELQQQLGRTNGGDGTARSIRVLLADDDPVVRGVLIALLDTEPSLELIGAAEDADGAIELAATAHPDVALLDLDMPGGGGWRAIEEIKSCCPETQSIALTALDTPEDQLNNMRSGAVDVLLKGASKEDIVAAIRSAGRWRPGGSEVVPESNGLPDSALPSPEDRIARLEGRVAALEESLAALLSRLES